MAAICHLIIGRVGTASPAPRDGKRCINVGLVPVTLAKPRRIVWPMLSSVGTQCSWLCAVPGQVIYRLI